MKRAIYLLCLAVMFATGLATRPLLSRALKSPALTSQSDPIEEQHQRWFYRRQAFKEHSQAGGADVIFLGDSITDGLGIQHGFSTTLAPLSAAAYGIAYDRWQNLLRRINDGELQGARPRVIVVLIGTNNIFSDTPESITEGIGQIVQKLPTKVLVLGLLPRTEEAVVRDKIRSVNAALAQLQNERVKVFDMYPIFVNADSRINVQLLPDMTHPSPDGYRAMLQAITPLIREMAE